MDDLLLNSLARALYSLEKDASSLDSMLLPRQAPSGENAGKAPAKKGSKVPLVVAVLDVKRDTEVTLKQWCGHLRAESPPGDVPPAGRSIAARAAWLQSRLLLIDAMPWGEMCAEQIIAVSRQVSDLVEPPDGGDEVSPIEVGPVKEIASWCRHLRVPVSTRSVYRWVRDDEVPSHLAPDGRLLVRLADVIDRARREATGRESIG